MSTIRLVRPSRSPSHSRSSASVAVFGSVTALWGAGTANDFAAAGFGERDTVTAA